MHLSADYSMPPPLACYLQHDPRGKPCRMRSAGGSDDRARKRETQSHVNRRSSILTLVILVFIACQAFAETKGKLFLKGTVPGTLRVSLIRPTGPLDRALSTHPDDVTLALFSTLGNCRGGYTITLSSENAHGGNLFFLKSSDSPHADQVPYTVACDGLPVRLKSGVALIADASGPTPSAGRLQRLAISCRADRLKLEAGTYGDTLIMAVATK